MADTQGRKPRLRYAVRFLLMTALLAYVLRQTVAEPLVVASEAMRPTLLLGDWVLVYKNTYGTDPFPRKPTTVVPRLGDVVVFADPAARRALFVRRVVGLPGNVVEIRRSGIIVNGKLLARRREQSKISCFDPPLQLVADDLCDSWTEWIGPTKYRVLTDFARPERTRYVSVPPGTVLALGDNRDNSADDGFLVGIPIDRILGRACVVVWSRGQTGGEGIVTWWKAIRWQRLFAEIK
jgi:signal peptidase I